jgi:hypothetical protein
MIGPSLNQRGLNTYRVEAFRSSLPIGVIHATMSSAVQPLTQVKARIVIMIHDNSCMQLLLTLPVPSVS